MDRRQFLAGAAALPFLPALGGCSVTGGPRPLSLAPVPPQAEGFSAEGIAALHAAMHRQVDGGTLSGIVTLLARHGRTVDFDAYGKKSLATGAPIQRDALFRLYSQTKPVTAAAMMILHDRGAWRLDDPVTRFIPEFANLQVLVSMEGDRPVTEPARRPPTMQEIMAHTAGFAYGIGLDDYSDQQLFKTVWNEGKATAYNYDEMLRRIAQVPLVFQPGMNWRYSIASDIQAALIERIARRSFGDFLKREIFDPLGMVDTGVTISAAQAARLVSLYTLGEDGRPVELGLNSEYIFPLDHTRPPIPFASGGGHLVSTAADYARFAQMLLNGGALAGHRILSRRAVDLMLANHVPPGIVATTQQHYGGPGQGFGFGMVVITDPVRAGLNGVPAGTILWGGLGGTWFLLDRTNDLFFLGMVNRAAEVPPADILPLAATRAIYAALTDRAR